MGDVRPVKSVLPVCAVTFCPGIAVEEVIGQLETVLGSVYDQSPVFLFSFTRYYAEEMGDELKKQYFSFVPLSNPGRLPEFKIQTNALESAWSENGKRRVNLDPGYVTAAKLVLASTKDYTHRIYLGDGIYGDVQLQFRDGCFRAQTWTYPDYQSDLALTFFHRVRGHILQEERKQ